MWSILAADLLIAGVFALELFLLWQKPPRPKQVLSAEELARLAGQLGLVQNAPDAAPAERKANFSPTPVVSVKQVGHVTRSDQHGQFSLVRPYQRLLMKVGVPSLLLFTAGLTVAWFLLLYYLGTLRLQELPSSFIVTKPVGSWFLLAPTCFFLGLPTAAIPASLLLSFLVRRRYAEFAHFEYEQSSPARRRALSAFLLVPTMVVLIVVTLCLNSYSRMDNQQIAINWWGVGERTRPYDSIDKIIVTSSWRASKNEIRSGKRLHIIFNDGEEWWCDWHNMRFGPSCRDSDELLNILSAKSGKPVTKALFIKDVTGQDEQ